MSEQAQPPGQDVCQAVPGGGVKWLRRVQWWLYGKRLSDLSEYLEAERWAIQAAAVSGVSVGDALWYAKQLRNLAVVANYPEDIACRLWVQEIAQGTRMYEAFVDASQRVAGAAA